jgi:hypothetical protein
MKYNHIKLIISLFFAFTASADWSDTYNVKNIPAELLADANSIYRLNNTQITFHNPGAYTIRTEKVITIMNENGKDNARLIIQYDKESNPKFIGGEIYDAEGKRTERIRKRDLTDQSNMMDFSLYDENRIMWYIPRIGNYPYTIRYEYEVNVKRGIYYVHPYYPFDDFNQSSQKSVFSLDYPEDIQMRIREFNFGDEIKETKSEKNRVNHTWTFSDLKGFRYEHLSRPLHEISPAILFTPVQFEYEGHRGRNDNWEDYGKWIWGLNAGRDNLPESRISQLHELVKDIENDRDKIMAIFKDMQTRTRYVNISLGIGGIQPFDAATVDRTGYGDCKALSNYMVSMLKAVGIKSYYTLINVGSGRYDFFPDLPASQFNHAIVCVPLANDTLWVECTSQQLPFAYIGDSRDNRHVLLITEKGGILTKTPAYDREENFVNSSAWVQLNTRGDGNARIRWSLGGINFGSVYGYSEIGPEDQRKWLYQIIPVSNFNLAEYSIKRTDGTNPLFDVDLEITLRGYASTSGQRLFIPLNMLSSKRETPPRIRNRQTHFELKFERVYNDTIVYSLPAGFRPEGYIPDLFFSSDFGNYSSKAVINGNELLYVRRLESFAGIFEPERYQEYVDFQQRILRADEQRLVLIKD